MNSTIESYTKFRNMLEKNGMGYEFDALNVEGELACKISFGILRTNYQIDGWNVICYKNDSSIYELQKRTYDYAIDLLERHEKMMEVDPSYLSKTINKSGC